MCPHSIKSGPGSVVGMATGYGLDGPGIESRWGEIFRTSPDRPWGLPSLLYNGYRVFPGGKGRPGRDADPSPPSSAVGHERVELYLYSPYGPYGLYSASVPVQGRTYSIKSSAFKMEPQGDFREVKAQILNRRFFTQNSRFTALTQTHLFQQDCAQSTPWCRTNSQRSPLQFIKLTYIRFIKLLDKTSRARFVVLTVIMMMMMMMLISVHIWTG
jgi:hypothetical protein